MSHSIARLRMFAGPNGSGKSTLKEVLAPELLGVYINPDELEAYIKSTGRLDFSTFGVDTSAEEILPFFKESSFLAAQGLSLQAAQLKYVDNQLCFADVVVNSYFASVAADFIRHKLLETNISFTFETVMSSPDKVAFLQKAQQCGFRTYLYYVATEDPQINLMRVANRVSAGGHAVPPDKIVTRYARSLALLAEAVSCTHRAYIFDNSSHEKVWVAEITNGQELELKANPMPYWFKTALWDKFLSEGGDGS